jgi:hypothetical protein
MALTQGDFQEYDFNRMVVRFTMKNDQADIACAISTDAMDQLDGSSRTTESRNAPRGNSAMSSWRATLRA